MSSKKEIFVEELLTPDGEDRPDISFVAFWPDRHDAAEYLFAFRTLHSELVLV